MTPSTRLQLSVRGGPETGLEAGSESNQYYISKVAITGLWGRRNLSLDLDANINMLIGRNASGKTTVLNLIRYVLELDLRGLELIEFDSIVLGLQAWKGKPRSKKVTVTCEDGEFVLKVGRRTTRLRRDPRRRVYARSFEHRFDPVVEELLQLVPTAWLSVSRRLPYDVDGHRVPPADRREQESVDSRLRYLGEQLTRYRLRLESEVSHLRASFQREAIELLLWDPDTDTRDALGAITAYSDEEGARLHKAFSRAGMAGKKVGRRVDQHIARGNQAVGKFSTDANEAIQLSTEDLVGLVLLRRTRALLEIAERFERDFEAAWRALSTYQELASRFFDSKKVSVSSAGDWIIESVEDGGLISVQHLSSGEKQILILLTEALINADRPVVYVADEPELSLHVTWQERLVESLLKLGGQIQLIVATHSPEIVGRFQSHVIDLSKK